MKISTKIRYGMRAMIELARNKGNDPVMIGLIARKQDLSEKYLEQLFTLLRNAGLVKSERGAKGGYRLAKDPDNITALEIFEAMNGPLELVDCSKDSSSCGRYSECDTFDLWKELDEKIRDVLSSKTLAELAVKGNDFLDYSI
jgi:Rrf2 family transcriptional regulator, cysteine metabolism repressor